jgi:hypothetical protein
MALKEPDMNNPRCQPGVDNQPICRSSEGAELIAKTPIEPCQVSIMVIIMYLRFAPEVIHITPHSWLYMFEDYEFI